MKYVKKKKKKTSNKIHRNTIIAINIIIIIIIIGKMKENEIKQFTLPSNGICTARDVPDIDIILISHNYYDYFEYDVIKYLYNNKQNIILLV